METNEMARRTQKSLESLAKQIAHRGEGLSNFERLLFWTRLLGLADPARAIAVMGGSAHPMDRDYFVCATTAGPLRARLVATVELAIASADEANPQISTTGSSPLGPDIFVWHDWPSFEMDLESWLAALPQAELGRELAQRVAAGLPQSTAARIARQR